MSFTVRVYPSFPCPTAPLYPTCRRSLGATAAIFPVDQETLIYLAGTGRDPARVEMVKEYHQAQGLFRTDDSPEPEFTDTLALDLGDIESSLAGPRRPQDRVPLGDMKRSFGVALGEVYGKPSPAAAEASDMESQTATTATAVAEPEGFKVTLESGERRHAGPRRGGHFSHNQLYQHIQSLGDGRRRAARKKSFGAWLGGQAMGEDKHGARFQGRH